MQSPTLTYTLRRIFPSSEEYRFILPCCHFWNGCQYERVFVQSSGCRGNPHPRKVQRKARLCLPRTFKDDIGMKKWSRRTLRLWYVPTLLVILWVRKIFFAIYSLQLEQRKRSNTYEVWNMCARSFLWLVVSEVVDSEDSSVTKSYISIKMQ